MSQQETTKIQTNLKELRQLIDRVDGTVDRQQQTMIRSREDMQTADELSRLLIYVRRSIEGLEQHVKEQDKRHSQIKALQDIGKVINSSLDLEEVLSFVMDAIIHLTKAERAILLLREESGELKVQLARNMDKETIEKSASFKISRSIVQSVAESGEAVATMNAQSDPRFAAQESIISYNLRSILCVPLMSKESVIGVIYADNRIAAGIFNDADRDMLTAFANQAAVAIENARLFRETQNHLAEIMEMKELMDNVFASIASGVITINKADRIELYNRAAEHLLGVNAESMVSELYHTCLDALGMPVSDLVEMVKSNGDIHDTEMDVFAKSRHDATTLHLTLSPLRGEENSEMLGVAMVLNDISEKKRLESVRRYLPPALVDQVRDIDAAQRPQRRVLSVLFADIRGFSTYSEHLDPEELIQVINGYFTEAVRAITHYEGMTDKFMGDAVMALFNTPLNPQEDHAARTVRAAWMMKQNMEAHVQTMPENRRIYFGIGVHTGDAVIGNVGSALRKDYSAIGDAVNLAKRVQETAKANQILLSQDTYEQVKEWVVVNELPAMRVKGRQAYEHLYEMIGIRE